MTETKPETPTPAVPRLWTPDGFAEDEWSHADSAEALAGNGRFILPLNMFLGLDADVRRSARERLGVLLAPGDPLDAIVDLLGRSFAGGARLPGLQRRPQLLQGRTPAQPPWLCRHGARHRPGAGRPVAAHAARRLRRLRGLSSCAVETAGGGTRSAASTSTTSPPQSRPTRARPIPGGVSRRSELTLTCRRPLAPSPPPEAPLTVYRLAGCSAQCDVSSTSSSWASNSRSRSGMARSTSKSGIARRKRRLSARRLCLSISLASPALF